MMHDDQHYQALTEKARNFVLYHDLGHAFLRDDNDVMSSEEAADKFARELVGKLSCQEAKALAKWISQIGMRDYNGTYNEFVQRFTRDSCLPMPQN